MSDTKKQPLSRVVLDASAILALLYREPGAERIENLLSLEDTKVLISSVNLSEIYARLLRDEVHEDEAFRLLENLKLTVAPFTEADAYRAGRLQRKGQTAGLSFGDRACLALAETHRAVAWTADRAWTKVELNVQVELIRA